VATLLIGQPQGLPLRKFINVFLFPIIFNGFLLIDMNVKKDKFFTKEKLANLFLIIFISLWMFSLGVFVGRKNAPNGIMPDKVLEELAVLKKDAQKNAQDFSYMNTDNKLNYDTLIIPQQQKPAKKPVQESVQKFGVSKKESVLVIQAASFKNEKDAEKVVIYLKKSGFDAYIMKADIKKKGIFHRVRIKNIENKKEAEEIIIFLKEKKFSPITIKELKQ
jgi:hypothetical protein